ncbi:MAG: erythromycin biosynthesis sensory transduction protein eryC1, partial [Cytophagales bacterium]
SIEKYYHNEIGFNMRMGSLEAVSLTIKLQYLDTWNQRRKIIAQRYYQSIQNEKITFQKQLDNTDSVYYLFVITTKERDNLLSYLAKNNVIAGLHYPVPCHLQKAYQHLSYKKGDFPHAEFLANHCLSLPIYPELTDFEVDKIIDVLNRY